jgi:hypothetical protein
MSILQEYESIRNEIGEKVYADIEKYLKQHTDVFLNDIYYNEECWNKFQEWRKGKLQQGLEDLDAELFIVYMCDHFDSKEADRIEKEIKEICAELGVDYVKELY